MYTLKEINYFIFSKTEIRVNVKICKRLCLNVF